jgi:hypothetical protein
MKDLPIRRLFTGPSQDHLVALIDKNDTICYRIGIHPVQPMPQGKHSSIRVALAVPPKLHEQLSAWAEYEGRPVASLCLYLIEHSLRQAQKEGIAPSFGSEGQNDPIDRYEFTGTRRRKQEEEEPNDKRIVKALLTALQDLEN